MEQQYSTEYVYYHIDTDELLTLFSAPADYTDMYDLAVEGEVVLMNLVYIGVL